MTDHYAVDRCASIAPWTRGYRCSCGRTILGRDRIDRHFRGEPMKRNDIIHRRYEAERLHEMAQYWDNAESAVRIHNRAMKIICEGAT